MGKRCARTTPQQFEIMVEFMCKHKGLLSGKMTQDFTPAVRVKLWKELTQLLNSTGRGPRKDTVKWRKTWMDFKSDVKKKAANIHYHKEKLNGPCPFILSPLEEKITAAMNSLKGQGINEVSRAKKISPSIIYVEAEKVHSLAAENELSSEVETEEFSIEAEDIPSTILKEKKPPATEDSDSDFSKLEAIIEAVLPYSSNDCEKSKNQKDDIEEIQLSADQRRTTQPNKTKTATLNALQSSPEISFTRKRQRQEQAGVSSEKWIEVEERKVQAISQLEVALHYKNVLAEQRNALLAERNEIERDRNVLLKSFLNAYISKK